MIYTVTLNPSLDYILSVENFEEESTNRATAEVIYPGGKGVNVSIVLANLGMQSIALGFCAGFTGTEIKRLLAEQNINNNFIELENGSSRINIKLRSIDGKGRIFEETEVNGIGPTVTDDALDKFYSQIEALENNDILVLSGSIPPSLPATIYKDIMQKLQNKDIKIVVDATKDLLTNVLEYKPFLIKPNIYELEDIFKSKINNENEAASFAQKLQKMGAQNVLVSMGEKGAILVDKNNNTYIQNVPEGEVKNSVGAGDSMVAGFLYGFAKTNNYEQALKYGICAGSASAYSEKLATKQEILDLYNQI